MTQAEYYTNLLTFLLKFAGIVVSTGLVTVLTWYFWTFARYLK